MSELNNETIRENMEPQEGGVELMEKYMVLAAPENSLEVTISAKVWHNGQVIEVHKTMDLEEIRAAFKDADNNYIPEDAVFTLTPLGKAQLEKLRSEQLAKFEEAE